MKKFLLKLFLFSSPLLGWMIVEGLLPVSTFTFRHYEAISFQTKVPHRSDYYPNIHSSMDAVGDLCHHTKNAVVKHETWIMDLLGFRNDSFVQAPDVLIVGDSFIFGTGLAQDETFTNQLAQKLSPLRVYNLSPYTLSAAFDMIADGRIQKPRLIIFSIVERNLPTAIEPAPRQAAITTLTENIFSFLNLNVFLDKALKFYSIAWLKSRINGTTGQGYAAIDHSGMFFLNGSNEGHGLQDLNNEAQVIVSYKKFCESQGIQFLFLPIPNKETVYYERVPFAAQPGYLTELDSVLIKSGVNSINTLGIFNDYRKHNNGLLYHLDDTHWNANATRLLSNALLKLYPWNTLKHSGGRNHRHVNNEKIKQPDKQ